MTINSAGYDGSVNEAEWAEMSSLNGGQYDADGHFAFQVLAGGSGARAVTIGAIPGTIYGDGITDTNDAPIVLNAAALASGTVRYDTVVIRRNWSGVGGSSTPMILQGTATRFPTRGTIAPGVQNDHLLALIKITSSADVQEVVDLRVWSKKIVTGWGAPDGHYLAPNEGSWYWDQASQEFWRGAVGDPIAGGVGWVNESAPDGIALPLAGGAGQLEPFNVGPSYRKGWGRVQLGGTIKRHTGNLINSTTVTDAILTTPLPSGYRPYQQRVFVVPELGGSDFARVVMSTAGVLSLLTDGKDIAGIALDGVSYIADGS